MPTFTIEGDCHELLARLFEDDRDGRLRFGWSGESLGLAKREDLLAAPVRFRDYILEGFLVYDIQAEDLRPGCRLRIRGEGSNRDQYIRSHARHFITTAGLAILAESDV